MNYYKIFLLLVLCIVSLFIGVISINVFNWSDKELYILLYSRLPRLISLILASMSISLAGLMMQNLMQNKFVSPSTAGTNEFIKLGLVVTLLTIPNVDPIIKALVAFLFSFMGTLLFLRIINIIDTTNKSVVAIIGIMLGSIVNSIATIIAYKNNLLQSIGGLLQGNFALISSGNYEMLYLIIPIVIITYLFASKIMVASLGNDLASALGLDFKQVQITGLLLVSLLVSIVTINVGVLPFLGLIVPNLVSRYYGDNFKRNISRTMYLGVILCLSCDILARVIIFPYEVSISLILGIIGSICFLYIILKGEKHG
ncbi:MAG: ABC transporter permease [Bacilli bacterium]